MSEVSDSDSARRAMVFENWVRGKLHELLGHYVEIDHDALKIGKPHAGERPRPPVAARLHRRCLRASPGLSLLSLTLTLTLTLRRCVERTPGPR